MLPTADGGDDRNLGGHGQGSDQATGVADGFVADKDVDVFADLAFPGDDAIAEAWIPRPRCSEKVTPRLGNALTAIRGFT